ncbi:outer membrane protein transport protein [Campylobacter canadensis]|uniref:OmpP1/FadL family transporter n=1 Tax=Campylobacter canadensis TaxID=449520 RepID=UPI001CCDBA63|nr:outer membrane protein transport protein [Campylobacter canadensis]MBZ7996890.1 outer membrane protein transport protein [Campylobacter canadensis]MBZ8000369.1 outer membrane protein transport protein [Campylobacter canadensis]MBZ8002170.1 outer membrane protein transport protein [Campylobacter canadensis]
MKKILLSCIASSFLLASNYRIVNLSSDAIALSGANLAKSYGADAAVINPANMAFLGQDAQLDLSLNYYHIHGSKYTDEYRQESKAQGKEYLNAKDDRGSNFNFGMPELSFVLPLNEEHYLGFAAYTDFDAVYGWEGNYAQSLVKKLDMRGGTLALSYAYKVTDEYSLAFSLFANHTKLKFYNTKDNALNQDYPLNPGYSSNITGYTPHWVYDASFKANNNIKFGFKTALTYVPNYLDNKFRFSLVYKSAYNNDFEGDLNVRILTWGMFDFVKNTMAANPSLVTSKLPQALVPILQAALGVFQQNPASFLNNYMTYNGNTNINLLYPASLNVGFAYEYDKHDFLLNLGYTFWSKFNGINLNAQVPELSAEDMKKIATASQTLAAANAAANGAAAAANGAANGAAAVASRAASGASQAIQALLADEKIKSYLLATMLNQNLDTKWKDTLLISLGYRYKYNDDLALMFGFQTENTPISRRDVTFLSKDSRVFMYSLGADYKYNKNLSFQSALAYQAYADIGLENNAVDDILIKAKGQFKDQYNIIFNMGLKYKF